MPAEELILLSSVLRKLVLWLTSFQVQIALVESLYYNVRLSYICNCYRITLAQEFFDAVMIFSVLKVSSWVACLVGFNKYPGFCTAMVDALASKTISWEKERGIEFTYDGVSTCLLFLKPLRG